MGIISDMFANSRYKAPSVRLPANGTIRCDNHGFEFDLPWPWFEVVEESSRAASDRVAEIAAPRTSGTWPGAVFSVERSGAPIDEVEVSATARQIAQQRGGQKKKPRRLRIAGLQAVDFISDDGTMRCHDLRMPVEESLTVRMEAWVPSEQADGYDVHLECMLASWRWFR